MDVIKFSDSGGLPIHQGIYGDDEDAGPSMEDIIMSMQSHLLAETAARLTGSSNAKSTPLPCPSMDNHHDHGEAGVFFSHESDNLEIDPETFACESSLESSHSARAVGLSNETGTKENTHHHGDAKVERTLPNGVPLLNLTSEGEDDYEVDLAEQPDLHPRLQTPFYEQLRLKYPKAFRRRHSSAGSEQSSICGDTPRSARPLRVSSAQTRTETRKAERKLPPKPPLSYSRKRTSSHTYDASVPDKEDLTITGCAPRRRLPKTPQQGKFVEGISRDWKSGSTTSLKRSDSTESVKDKLRRNSESLKSLLCKENSPFRSHRPRKSRSNVSNASTVVSDSTSSDFSLPRQTIKPIPKPSMGLQQMQSKIAENYSQNAQSLQPHRQSLVDNPRKKNVVSKSKRFASPDSPGDSAVDMDTASLHSSPSSDTQVNSVPRAALGKPLEIQTGLPPGQGFLNAVAEMQLHAARQVGLADSHLPHVSSASQGVLDEIESPVYSGSYNRDSDVDSGIAQPFVHRFNGRSGRHSSVSSLEMDHDSDSPYRSYGFHGGVASISSGDLRINQHDGTITHGPIKANHNIAISSPHHQSRDSSESEMENWHRQGARPKVRRPQSAHSRRAASVTDLARQRASPTNRVHFEDEVYGGFGLSPHQRTQSQPDLSKQGALPPPGRKLRSKPLSGSRSKVNGYVGTRLQEHSSPSLAPSESEEELARYALSPGSRLSQDSEAHELQKRVHKSRSRSTTPAEAALSTSDEDLESMLEVHRASPAIVVPSTSNVPDQLPQSRSSTPASDMLLAHELALCNSGFYEDLNGEKPKKSKKFWKKNKGRYTPSEEIEKVQQQIMHERTLSQSMQDISRPSSARSEVIASKPPMAKKPPRPSSASAGVGRKGQNGQTKAQNGRTYENIHKEDAGSRVTDLGEDENPYEDIEVVQALKKSGPESVSSTDSRVHEHGSVRSKHRKIPPTPPPPAKNRKKDYNPDGVIYAQVVKKTKQGTLRPASSNPCIVSSIDGTEPKKGQKSNLEKSKDLSGSRTSLSEKVGSFRNSARKGFSRLKRALSLDRIDKASQEKGVGETWSSNSGQDVPEPGSLQKSPSLRSLTERLSLRKKSHSKEDLRSIDSSPSSTRKFKRPPVPPMRRKHSTSMSALDSVDTPTNFRPIGKLVKLNSDGTQVLELTKPPHGPFGFYIARGSAKYNHGIFISRLSDGLPERFFAGLLGLGDEILEINQQAVQNMSLEEVYDMMGYDTKLTLKTLPFMARQDS